MELNDKVLISSTEELNTKFNGTYGYVHHIYKGKNSTGWYQVLTKDGETHVFHESQLTIEK